MRAKKKRVIVIVSLCVLLLIMSAGYAAFSSVLNIKGTSSITSNWDIKITNVKIKNTNGSAENTKDPIWDNLTATVEADLYDPGDYVEYEITIENKGNLNAKLSKISMSDVNDSPIKFTTSGVTEGDNLNTNSSATLTVKIEYDSSAGKVSEDVSSELTITLEYVQANVDNSGIAFPGMQIDDLKSLVVTTGDGLYLDTYGTKDGYKRYVYKGANPDNYITFNNELWRIISIETDGTLKIMKKDSIGDRPFDSKGYRDSTSNGAGGTYCAGSSYGCNAWAKTNVYDFVNGNISGQVSKDSELNTYLNNDYYNTLSSDAKELIYPHIFEAGPVQWENTDLAAQITSEYSAGWVGNIGLITASDFIRANTNTGQCGDMKSQYNNRFTCQNTNWLNPSSGFLWAISPHLNDSFSAYLAGRGYIGNAYVNEPYGVFPTLCLKSSIRFEGEGTESNPYTIMQ